MSIIFQKLKNLRKKTEKQEKVHPKLHQGGNVYTFRRLIFSPMGALIITSSIVGFGILSFYALSFLKDYLDSGSSRAIVVQRHQSAAFPDDGMVPGMNGLPGDPANNPNQHPGVVPGDKTPQKPPENFKVPDYFIQQVKNDASQYQENDPATSGPAKDTLNIPDEPDHIPGHFSKNQFLPSVKSVYTTLLRKKKNLDHLSPKTATLNPDKAPIESKDASGPSATYSMAPEPTLKPENKMVSEKQRQEITRTPSEKAMSAEKKAAAKKQVIRLAKQKRTQKVSAIATLAAELTNAIEENDRDRTDLLLEKLSFMQDNNSSYYIKLKAFKEIREENYDAAKTLLNKILAKDKTDFEAGINMAIIEIKEEKFVAAKQRLTWLKDNYPSRSEIDDLLNML